MADVVGHWYGKRPEVFENRDLDLAVATGAAYYSYVRSTGSGVLVRGGLPRTYYLGIGEPQDGKIAAVCLVPRGAEEGLDARDRSRRSATGGQPAGVVPPVQLADAHRRSAWARWWSSQPAMRTCTCTRRCNAVIRFGKKAGERLIPVKVGARLTEIGTLETWCESKISDNRWRLQFELRKTRRPSLTQRKPAAVISEEAVRAGGGTGARGFLADRQSADRARRAARASWNRRSGLGRNSWPLETIRQLADAFLENADGRKKSPAFEARWLNLGGFCLRPGFGFPGDDFRIEQARRIYAAGLQYANQVQCEIDWWIFWGRVAGGLNRNQQVDVYQRLSPSLLPRGSKKQRAEQQPAAGDVAHGGQPGTAADRRPRPNWATRWCDA